MSSARERAVAWRHAYHAVVCGVVEPWVHGTVVGAPDLPTYYDYDLVRIEGGDPGLGAEALAAAAEPALEGLGHRRLEIEDTAAGERLLEDFARLGWVTERLAYLHRELPGPPVRAPEGAELQMEPFEATRPLRREWQGESIWGDPPAFVMVEEAVAARRGTKAVTARLDGELSAFAAFSAAGGAAEIETVFCRPERRGEGLGGALVARALEEAAASGAREAFIEADDDGDAKRLYERLGFRTVWRRCSFTKVLS